MTDLVNRVRISVSQNTQSSGPLTRDNTKVLLYCSVKWNDRRQGHCWIDFRYFMTSSKMVLVQYVVSKSYDWHWKRTNILVFCRGYDNVLTLFFNLQKRSLACRQPGTPNTLITMVHGQAFLFVTDNLNRVGPLSATRGALTSSVGLNPVNCIMVHWNKFDVCDFNYVYKEGE